MTYEEENYKPYIEILKNSINLYLQENSLEKYYQEIKEFCYFLNSVDKKV